MDASTILHSMRTLVLVVDGGGTIIEVAGGFGGFFDIEVAAMAGTSVFDHIAPEDADELAMAFIEDVSEEGATAALPMPFRVSFVDGSGMRHPVDVIPTGLEDGDGSWRWTVTIVPVSLNGSITRSLDLEMTGAPRDDVRRMLCEELLVDGETYTRRWFLIDLADPSRPTVLTARDDATDVVDAIAATVVANGWHPWRGLVEQTCQALDAHAFPEPLAGVMRDRAWNSSVVSPVHVEGELVAAYLMLGVVPRVYSAGEVKWNLASRIQALVRATSMLMTKWREHDQLMLAATRDSLTGLANRDAFFAALDAESRVGALLYIDVDKFKSVNDTYGHEVGDRVLIVVADRIGRVCRSLDLVSRFGGDEFVVLLRLATADVARDVAERILEAVAEPLDIAAGPSNVSVSVGLSMIANGDNPLDAADQALLDAKRSGRGRLSLALVPAAT